VLSVPLKPQYIYKKATKKINHKAWIEYLVVVVELAAGVLVAILSDLLLNKN
jgi:hypothetical protein